MIYLDTSVALLSLLGQPGADEAARLIMDAHATEGLVSSCLLTVEMARAAHREHFDIHVVDEFDHGRWSSSRSARMSLRVPAP